MGSLLRPSHPRWRELQDFYRGRWERRVGEEYLQCAAFMNNQWVDWPCGDLLDVVKVVAKRVREVHLAQEREAGADYDGYFCAVADTPWGQIPGEAANGKCWYEHAGEEYCTENFKVMRGKLVDEPTLQPQGPEAGLVRIQDTSFVWIHRPWINRPHWIGDTSDTRHLCI